MNDTVTQVWCELLGRSDVDPDASWFALGGDSMLAIEAVARLRERGAGLTVAAFLQAGTVRALADLLASAPSGDGAAVARRPAGTPVPLTPIQAWFFAQDFAEPHHFNQARLLPVPKGLSPSRVQAALEAVVGRHEAFRTCFTFHHGTWSAHLDDQPPAVDLATYPLAPGTDRPSPEVLDRLHQGLDLAAGPLWRAALFTGAGQQLSWVCLVAHHLIVDAVSWGILARDWHSACAQEAPRLPAVSALTTPPPLPDEEEAAYWRRLATAGAPRLHLTDGERAPYGKLEHHTLDLPAHRTSVLLGFADSGQATVPALVLAALARALAPLTRGDGLYVNLEGHGRQHLAVGDQVVGWLTSLYPLHLTPAPEADDRRHLLRVAAAFQQQMEAVPYGGTGYGTARYLTPGTALGRELAAMPRPEVTFNYLGRHATTSAPAAGAPGQGIGPGNVLPTALHLTAWIEDQTLRLHLYADAGIFPAGAIDEICTRLRTELDDANRIVPLGDRPVSGARPHFFIHPVDGQVHHFQPLARALGIVGWDCYGLHAEPTGEAEAGIEALAASYLARVRSIQPAGGYCLTGYSFGAAVAFAMARLLQAAGKRVDHLILLDPPPLPAPQGAAATTVLAEHLAALLPHAPRHAIDDALGAVGDGATEHQLAEQLGLDGDGFVTGRLELLLRHHRALARWAPSGTVESLHLIQPSATAAPPHEGWCDLALTVRRSVVPGDHRSMLTEPAPLATLYPSPLEGGAR
ncbi:condensation domain-containing protein [Streptomyces sp. NPDC021100]|uniref:condensation domain-containing protein n=1 Tax=Streptomyces sp. NPDC021100 TaxID=3365114 RepID=UPI00378D2F47